MSDPNPFSLIGPAMQRVEEQISSSLYSKSRIVEQMLRHTLDSKGKRLRPALVFLSAKATGDLRDVHVDVAAAIELIHTATLVHDDIIDEATLRRQKTSLNAQYGNEMAVIFGDYVLAVAFGILAKITEQGVLSEITRVTNTICEGELFQTHRRFDFNLSRSDYLKMIEQKTASLFAVSCALGAMLAGANQAQQQALEKFGEELGMAFQIVDDCLDILGDEQRMGKSLGTDLKKGKWTLPLIRLREVMKESDWEEVRMLLFEDLEEVRMKRLVSYLQQYDAVQRAVEDARARINKAKSYLQVIPACPALEALHQLAEEVLQRHRLVLDRGASQNSVATPA